MPTMRAKVFEKDGNRFLIPGMWSDDTENTLPMSSVIIDAMMYRVTLGLNDGGEIEIETDKNGKGQIAHVNVDILSRALAHGGCTVMCIGGPLFEKVASEVGERP